MVCRIFGYIGRTVVLLSFCCCLLRLQYTSVAYFLIDIEYQLLFMDRTADSECVKMNWITVDDFEFIFSISPSFSVVWKINRECVSILDVCYVEYLFSILYTQCGYIFGICWRSPMSFRGEKKNCAEYVMGFYYTMSYVIEEWQRRLFCFWYQMKSDFVDEIVSKRKDKVWQRFIVTVCRIVSLYGVT